MADPLAGPDVVVVPDGAALNDEAARRVEAAVLGVPQEQPVRIALAGGSTPVPLYRHLASRPLPWSRMEFFFTDERCVGPDDARSNFAMVRGALLDRVPIAPAAVHRIPGELAPADAARRAADDLRESWGEESMPVLDLVVLGMGADGHTASLFPADPALDAESPLARAIEHTDSEVAQRVTLALGVLNAARQRLVLVSGEEKASALTRALAGDAGVPAGRLSAERTTWIVTEDAAVSLDQS